MLVIHPHSIKQILAQVPERMIYSAKRIPIRHTKEMPFEQLFLDVH